MEKGGVEGRCTRCGGLGGGDGGVRAAMGGEIAGGTREGLCCAL